MKILFYIEPLIEQDKPYWKDIWVSTFCKDIINTLTQSNTAYNFLIMTNEAIAQKVSLDTPIIQLTQKELLEPFKTTNYLDVTTSWHLGTYTTEQLKNYHKLMLEKLDGFVPDIIITFSPVPFFREMFPNTLILHHEYSIFSRPPYPMSWFLDPVGTPSNLFLNKFQDQIRTIKLSEKQINFISSLKSLAQNILKKKSPFQKLFAQKRQQFDYLILLPLQFSRYFSFDDLVPFKSQYEYCVYVLDNTPSNIGVVVNTHPEYPAISEEAIEFLRTKYSNFIYEDKFNSISASGQFILPFVDAVITVSSSLGLQTLLFDKKLITLSDKTYSFIADGNNLNSIEDVLKSETSDKNSFLYYILTKYAITPKYLHNPKWLDTFLKNSLDEYRQNGITFDFYKDIDQCAHIFESLESVLKEQSNLVPNVVSQKYIQLFIDTGCSFNEKESIKISYKDQSTIQFDLKEYKNTKALRFDPLNDYAVVKIKSILIDDKNYKSPLNTNAFYNEDQTYYFFTKDSNIFLDTSAFECMSEINFDLEYLHTGENALNQFSKILESKNQNIQRLNEELKDKDQNIQRLEHHIDSLRKELTLIYAGKSWLITKPLRKAKQLLKRIKK